MPTYPTEIIAPLKARIDELEKQPYSHRPRMLPSDETLQDLIDTAFHASLLTEEGRRPGFRLMYCSPQDLSGESERGWRHARRIVRFPKPRDFTVSELNRVAPASDLRRFLICVGPISKRSKKTEIWGLLDVGDNWWKFIHHEASGGMPPPNYLALTSTAPGELSFSLQGHILLQFRSGAISFPTGNPIWGGGLEPFFEPAQKDLYKGVVDRLQSKKWDEEGSDDDYPERFYNFFVERIIHNVRDLAHGGTILFVPHGITSEDSRISDRIIFKYRTDYNYAWDAMERSLINHRKYYDLYFPLMHGKEELSTEKFARFTQLSSESDAIDEELCDIASCIASLTSVDGALVLTSRFSVLGFGGEIIAQSPTLSKVRIAGKSSRVPIDSFGTRHRSAFRFCSSFEDSVGFIVSSDGGVKAVKREGPGLLFWPDINEGAMGL